MRAKVYSGFSPACNWARPARRQEGVALAIVMWFVAGMSLLVSGIVAQARVDTQLAQVHVARAKAVAAGDGAIQLALLDIVADPSGATERNNEARNYSLGDLDVEVGLLPTSGFLDLNNATEAQLAALLTNAAKLPSSEAKYLASNVIKWRSNKNKGAAKKPRRTRFDVPEDLLLVEGFTRSLLDGIRDYVVAGKPSQGQLDLSVAPDYVRDTLSKATPGQSGRRGAESGGAAVSRIYRADAVVVYGDQRWLRRRWVAMGSVSGSSLPWRILRTEPPRVYEY